MEQENGWQKSCYNILCFSFIKWDTTAHCTLYKAQCTVHTSGRLKDVLLLYTLELRTDTCIVTGSDTDTGPSIDTDTDTSTRTDTGIDTVTDTEH